MLDLFDVAPGPVLGKELVLASAGSGKTYRLSSRLIGLLAIGIPPEEILASTFTRKAAGEIVERVLLRLAEAVEDPAAARDLVRSLPPDVPRDGLGPEGLGALLERTVRGLHRLHVHTLDAFFHRVARSFALELGLPRSWTVADEADQDRMRSDAIEGVLARADNRQLLELVRLVGRGDADRDVHSTLRDGVKALHLIYRELDPAVADPWGSLGDVAPFAEEEDRGVAELVDVLQAAAVPLTAKGIPDKLWDEARDKAVDRLRKREWGEFLKGGIARALMEGRDAYRGKPIPVPLQAVYRGLIDGARAALAASYQGRLRALGRFLPEYDRRLEALARGEGRYSFDDLIHFLARARALVHGDELFYRLDGRVRHVLIDEFQDTSNAQWAALEPIVGEILSGYEGEQAAFLVGDPKQSIYGWRGGEPRILEAVASRYALEPLTMAKSYRSSPVVLGVVNHVFEGIASNPVLEGVEELGRSWARSFEPHLSAHGLPGYVRLEVGPEEDPGGRGKEFPRLLDHAAARVKALHDQAPDATIGVLTRTNRAGAHLIARLRELGLEASEEGGVPVADSGPVLSLLALLRLADHPGDRISRYLVAMTAVGELVGFGPDAWQDDAQAARVSREVRERLVEEGYGRVISGWVRELSPRFPERDRRRLRQLTEQAFRWEERATLRPSDFARMVKKVRAEDPAASAVRVMTLWRAKGLEFDAVVLPELDALWVGGEGTDPYLPYRADGTGPVVRVFPRPVKSALPLFPQVDEAVAQARERDVRDALSSLYVGLTRARYAVYVYVKPDSEGRSTAKTAARLLRAAVAPGAAAPVGAVPMEEGVPEWWKEPKVAALLRKRSGGALHEAGPAEPLRLSRAARRRHLAWQAPSQLEGGGRIALDRLLNPGREVLEVGTAAHAWLETIGWLEDGIPDDKTFLGCALERAPALRDPHALLADFRRWLEAPEIRALLTRSAFPEGTRVERELPFVARDGDRLLRGSVDRVVRIPDPAGDRLLVVDWKTDDVAPEDEGALDERVAFYSPQMEAYARALVRVEGVPRDRITTLLAFLVPGRTVPASAP